MWAFKPWWVARWLLRLERAWEADWASEDGGDVLPFLCKMLYCPVAICILRDDVSNFHLGKMNRFWLILKNLDWKHWPGSILLVFLEHVVCTFINNLEDLEVYNANGCCFVRTRSPFHMSRSTFSTWRKKLTLRIRGHPIHTSFSLTLNNPKSQSLPSGKLPWKPGTQSYGGFSKVFQNQWFSGSMLVFRGVTMVVASKFVHFLHLIIWAKTIPNFTPA